MQHVGETIGWRFFLGLLGVCVQSFLPIGPTVLVACHAKRAPPANFESQSQSIGIEVPAERSLLYGTYICFPSLNVIILKVN